MRRFNRCVNPLDRRLFVAVCACTLSLKGMLAIAQPPQTEIAEDAIFQGGVCVGLDCSGGQVFTDRAQLIIKENNTRVRFYDTSAPDILGSSWSVTANESSNGGPSLFGFEAKSLSDTDAVRISDGRTPGTDCSDGDTFDAFDSASWPGPTEELVPFGEPIIVLITDTLFSTDPPLYVCGPALWYAVERVLDFGDGAHDSVTLGGGSEPTAGQVSVGSPWLLRRLKHVATPTEASDVLTVRTLTTTDSVLSSDARQAQIASLKSQLVLLVSQISALEDLAYAASPTQIVRTDYGDGEIYLYVVAGEDYLPVVTFNGTCTDGSNEFTGSGSTSLLLVEGLTNGVAYTCSVTTTNAAETGPASLATASITPEEIAPGLPVWLLNEAIQ